MSKILKFRNEILKIKDTLVRYRDSIPGNQKPRFDKDLLMIFQDVEKIEVESELSKMEKLAKTKLKSIQRIYGTIRDETKEESNRVEFISKEMEEFLIKEYGIDPSAPFKSKFKDIKNSPAFNPQNVKRYQAEHKRNSEIISEAFNKAMEQIREEKEKSKEQITNKIFAQDSELDINKCRDKDGKIVKDKLREAIRDVMLLNNLQDRSEEFDYDKIIEDIESGKMKLVTDESEVQQLNELKNANVADTTKTEELFSVFSNSKKYNEEDVDKFVETIKPILNNKNLNEEQKQILLKKELKKAEDEWNQKNMDGMVSYNMYGQMEVTFFKNKEETQEKENEKKQNGIKNYVWRDGKLVEGKSKERKAVTYSNWHAGHHNPDDLRRHRELLDRQHYGGPLWEGIKYQSIINDKSSLVINSPSPEYLETLRQMTPDNQEGEKPKKEYVEIVR